MKKLKIYKFQNLKEVIVTNQDHLKITTMRMK